MMGLGSPGTSGDEEGVRSQDLKRLSKSRGTSGGEVPGPQLRGTHCIWELG